MGFCKGFIGKNLGLSCASHQFLWVCNSIDLDEVTPSLDDEFPLHLAIIVETVPLVSIFVLCLCPSLKYVFAEGEDTRLAHDGETFTGDQFMLTLILWPHICIPSPHKAEPMFCPDWEQQLWAHFLEPLLDVEMGWGALSPLKSLSSPVTSLRPEQLTPHNAAIVLIQSDQFWKCFSKSILQHYKKIISCLRRSPSGV